jgi:HTH-type transcriptional regulator/antitoxin HigA
MATDEATDAAALNRQFPLRPIRSDEELSRAQSIIDSLLDKGDDVDHYLDVLSDLVRKYETETHPIQPVSAEQMLRHILESRELTQAEVARGAGIAEPTISAVLAGRRKLNRDHIAALSAYFGVSPAVFF